MIDALKLFFTNYGMEVSIGVVSFIGGICSHVGKLLISSHLTKREKLAEKKAAITEEFYKKVYHIDYLITEYLKEFSDSETSLSGLGINDTYKKVLRIFRELIAEKYQYEEYLSKHDRVIYEQLMTSIRDEYDGSSEDYGQWMPDDDISPLVHATDTLTAIQTHTQKCLSQKVSPKKSESTNR